MNQFPSLEWFEAVQEQFNNDDSYRHGGGGRCDCTMGVKIGKSVFVVTFEGFECTSTEEGSESKLDDVDFYLRMNLRDWKEMLVNIRDHGHAVDRFTLNTLDLDRADGLATSKHGDQYREDLFFRYNQTVQYFFDASSRVETSFG